MTHVITFLVIVIFATIPVMIIQHICDRKSGRLPGQYWDRVTKTWKDIQ